MWNSLAERGNCHIPEAVSWQCDCFFLCDEEREGQERGNGRKWRDLGKNILEIIPIILCEWSCGVEMQMVVIWWYYNSTGIWAQISLTPCTSYEGKKGAKELTIAKGDCMSHISACCYWRVVRNHLASSGRTTKYVLLIGSLLISHCCCFSLAYYKQINSYLLLLMQACSCCCSTCVIHQQRGCGLLQDSGQQPPEFLLICTWWKGSLKVEYITAFFDPLQLTYCYHQCMGIDGEPIRRRI